MSSPYYPAFLNLEGKRCVVVGGGLVAERKVRDLRGAGASVTIVSPSLTPRLRRLVAAGGASYIQRRYRKGDVRGVFLVIAATSDHELNRAVAADAGCLANVVDAPGLGNFIVPAVVRRDPLTVAVSTGGASPALAAEMRKEIEALYGSDVARYVRYLGRARKRLLAVVTKRSGRETLLKALGSREMLETARREGFAAARRRAEACMAEARK